MASRTKGDGACQASDRQRAPRRGPRGFHRIPFSRLLLGLKPGPRPAFPKSAPPPAPVPCPQPPSPALRLGAPHKLGHIQSRPQAGPRSRRPAYASSRVPLSVSLKMLTSRLIVTRDTEASGNCSSVSLSPNALPGSARSAAIVPRADACCRRASRPFGG